MLFLSQSPRLDATVYDRLNILDLFTLRIVLVYDKLLILSLISIILTLFSSPNWLISTAWVTYFCCVLQVFYLQLRFKKWGFAFLILLTILVNGLEFFKFLI